MSLIDAIAALVISAFIIGAVACLMVGGLCHFIGRKL